MDSQERLELKVITIEHRLALVERFVELRFCESFRDFSVRCSVNGPNPGNNTDNDGFFGGGGTNSNGRPRNVPFRDWGGRPGESYPGFQHSSSGNHSHGANNDTQSRSSGSPHLNDSLPDGITGVIATTTMPAKEFDSGEGAENESGHGLKHNIQHMQAQVIQPITPTTGSSNSIQDNQLHQDANHPTSGTNADCVSLPTETVIHLSHSEVVEATPRNMRKQKLPTVVPPAQTYHLRNRQQLKGDAKQNAGHAEANLGNAERGTVIDVASSREVASNPCEVSNEQTKLPETNISHTDDVTTGVADALSSCLSNVHDLVEKRPDTGILPSTANSLERDAERPISDTVSETRRNVKTLTIAGSITSSTNTEASVCNVTETVPSNDTNQIQPGPSSDGDESIIVLSSDGEEEANNSSSSRAQSKGCNRQIAEQSTSVHKRRARLIGSRLRVHHVSTLSTGSLQVAKVMSVTSKQLAEGGFVHSLPVVDRSIRVISFGENRTQPPQTKYIDRPTVMPSNGRPIRKKQLKRLNSPSTASSLDKSKGTKAQVPEDSDSKQGNGEISNEVLLVREVVPDDDLRGTELKRVNEISTTVDTLKQQQEQLGNETCQNHIASMTECDHAATGTTSSTETMSRKPPPLLPYPSVSQLGKCVEESLPINSKETETRLDSDSPDPPPLSKEVLVTSTFHELDTQELADDTSSNDLQAEDSTGEPAMPVLSAAAVSEAIRPVINMEEDHMQYSSTELMSTSAPPLNQSFNPGENANMNITSDMSVEILQDNNKSMRSMSHENSTVAIGEEMSREKVTQDQGSSNLHINENCNTVPLSELTFDRKCRKRFFYCPECETSFTSKVELDEHRRTLHVESDAEDESVPGDDTDYETLSRTKRQQKKSARSRNSLLAQKSSPKKSTVNDSESETDTVPKTLGKDAVSNAATRTTALSKNCVKCPYCGSTVRKRDRFRHMKTTCKITPEQLMMEEASKGVVTWEPAYPKPKTTVNVAQTSDIRSDSSKASGTNRKEVTSGLASGKVPLKVGSIRKSDGLFSNTDEDDDLLTNNKRGRGRGNLATHPSSDIIEINLENESSDSFDGPQRKRQKSHYVSNESTPTLRAKVNKAIEVMDLAFTDLKEKDESEFRQKSSMSKLQEEANELVSASNTSAPPAELNHTKDTLILSEAESNPTEAVDSNCNGHERGKEPEQIFKNLENGGLLESRKAPHELVPCPRCQKYMLRKSLKRHMRDRCKAGNNKLERCKAGNNKLEGKLPLTEMVCKCYDCGYIPKNYRDYQFHLTVHPPEKAIPCHVCKNVFIEELNLQDHLKTHQVCVPHDATMVYIKQSKIFQPLLIIEKLALENA